MIMTSTLWDEVSRFFKPYGTNDHWGDPMKMKYEIVYGLFHLRKFIDRPIHVHCGFEKRTDKPKSTHNFGMAVDCHADGIHPGDLFIAASRFIHFRGIGVYPYWNNPGVHLDCREYEKRMQPEARWGRNKKGGYVKLDWDFLKELK